MKKRLTLLYLSCLVSFILILSACEPAIPHTLDGRKDCNKCHNLNSDKPYPNWHAKRGLGNDDCTNCHDVKNKTDN